MGEANARTTTEGWITKREQVLLGLLSMQFGRDPAAQGKDGQKLKRALKARLLDQLGVGWVAERLEDVQGDPERSRQPPFTPEERSHDKVKIALDRDVLAFLIDELDKVPVGTGDDARIHALEDRFSDMKAGNLAMPAELLAPAAPLNGTSGRIEDVILPATPAPQA